MKYWAYHEHSRRSGPSKAWWTVPCGLGLVLIACGGGTDLAPNDNRTVYDLTSPERDLPTYVAKVDTLDIQAIDLASPRGGPLYVGHPVHLTARLDVLGEPFHASLYYGLETDDAHCLVGEGDLSHLPGYFDDAERASVAAASKANDEVPTPSLATCDPGAPACAGGEQCLAFREESALAPPPAQLPDPVDAGTDAIGPEPATGPELATTVVVSRCATQAWAERAAYRAKHPGGDLTPADLAGSKRAEHSVDESTPLPASCRPLIGKPNLRTWLAFDPEGKTAFSGRTLPAADRAASTEDRAFTSRLPTSEVDEPVRLADDPGLDVQLESISLSSALTELKSVDPAGGDFMLDTQVSVDGLATPEQLTALKTGTVTYGAKIRPLGSPRAGCTPSVPSPALDAVLLDIVTPQGGTPNYSSSVTSKLHAENVEVSHALPLHYPSALRTKMSTGEWACWDDFAVDVCLTSNVQQNSAPGEGTEDDCATTGIKVSRVSPDIGPVSSPISSTMPPVLAKFVNGCDESKFRTYVDAVNKWRALENSAHVTDTRIYDFGKWMTASIWYAPYQPDRGWRDMLGEGGSRRSGYHQYLEGCVNASTAGGAIDWSNWFCKYSPWNINYGDYKSVLVPYFWNNYQALRNDPIANTRSGFNFECAGIASGAVCSTINNDPNRVGELAARIRKLLERPWDHSDPLNDLMSPNGRSRCLGRALPALVPYKVAADGTVNMSSEPADYDRFYNEYLPQVCEKGRYKAVADAAWADIAASCTYVSKPFSDSGSGIYAGRLVPEMYKTYETGTLGGLKAVVEGGVVNDYVINSNVNQFFLTFGPQVRVYLDADPSHEIAGNFAIKDIFSAWMQGKFYSDVVNSQATAGFHVLTHDVWKLSFPIPATEFEYPNPPELAKEKKKCKYIWKPPMPVRIELCGGIGGKVALDVSAKIFKRGVSDDNASGRPGVSGTVTPRVAITTVGSAGVDYWVGVAGLELNLDPTLGIALPITTSAKWDLRLGPPSQRSFGWALEPGIRADLQLQALGGSIEAFNRLRFGGSESRWEVFAWDPLTLASWNLVDKSHVFSGTKNF